MESDAIARSTAEELRHFERFHIGGDLGVQFEASGKELWPVKVRGRRRQAIGTQVEINILAEQSFDEQTERQQSFECTKHVECEIQE